MNVTEWPIGTPLTFSPPDLSFTDETIVKTIFRLPKAGLHTLLKIREIIFCILKKDTISPLIIPKKSPCWFYFAELF